MFKSLLVALSFVLLFISQIATAKEDRVRLRCDANGVNDTSMSAKYEERGNRKKFDVEFEAAANLDFSEGDVLAVRVGGVRVGDITLGAQPNGDLGGDLEFDNNDDGNPFPADFPDIGEGTSVTVGGIGCDLD